MFPNQVSLPAMPAAVWDVQAKDGSVVRAQ